MIKVKKLFLFLALLLPASAFATGGTCPTGANYFIPPANFTATLSQMGVTNCYFIAANGADTNTGTSESAPWLHAPGMANCASTCATVTPAAGQGFIFRGGDSWHFGDSTQTPYVGATIAAATCGGVAVAPNGCQWYLTSGGSKGSPTYFGIDATWYNSTVCGSAWCRPILQGDNPHSTTGVTSCAFNESSETIISVQHIYNTWQGFEVDGFCWGGSGSPTLQMWSTSDSTWDTGHNFYNIYIHGWSHVTFSCYTFGGGTCSAGTWQASTAYALNQQIIVSNGSTSCIIQKVTTAGTSGTTAPTWSTTSGTTETDNTVTWTSQGVGGTCQGMNAWNGNSQQYYEGNDTWSNVIVDGSDTDQNSGAAMYASCANVQNSVFRYLGQGVVCNNHHSFHDNLIEYVNYPGDGLAHQNMLEFNSENCLTSTCASGNGNNNAFYGNIFRHAYLTANCATTSEVNVWTTPNQTDFHFNNLFYDIPCDGNFFIHTNDLTPHTGWTAHVFNNTFVQGQSTTAMHLAKTGATLWFNNNHCITASTPPAACVDSSAGTLNTTAASIVQQSLATANGQGYTASQTFPYSPTSGTPAASVAHVNSNLHVASVTSVSVTVPSGYGGGSGIPVGHGIIVWGATSATSTQCGTPSCIMKVTDSAGNTTYSTLQTIDAPSNSISNFLAVGRAATAISGGGTGSVTCNFYKNDGVTAISGTGYCRVFDMSGMASSGYTDSSAQATTYGTSLTGGTPSVTAGNTDLVFTIWDVGPTPTSQSTNSTQILADLDNGGGVQYAQIQTVNAAATPAMTIGNSQTWYGLSAALKTTNNATMGTGLTLAAYNPCGILQSLAGNDAVLQAAVSACQSDTGYACVYNTTSHTVTCPNRASNPRPVNINAAQDSGAYLLKPYVPPAPAHGMFAENLVPQINIGF